MKFSCLGPQPGFGRTPGIRLSFNELSRRVWEQRPEGYLGCGGEVSPCLGPGPLRKRMDGQAGDAWLLGAEAGAGSGCLCPLVAQEHRSICWPGASLRPLGSVLCPGVMSGGERDCRITLKLALHPQSLAAGPPKMVSPRGTLGPGGMQIPGLASVSLTSKLGCRG